MYRLLAPLLGLILPFSVALSAVPAHADTKTIPASDYPAGSAFQIVTPFSNGSFDRNWGQVDPATHSQPAAALGRITGWEQLGVLNQPEHTQAFALIVSVYPNHDAAMAAEVDYVTTVQDTFGAMPRPQIHHADGSPVEELTENEKRWTVHFAVAIFGSLEVEGAAVYRTGHHDAPVDKADLLRQMAAAGTAQ